MPANKKLQDMSVQERLALDVAAINELTDGGHLSVELQGLALRWTQEVADLVHKHGGVASEYQALSKPIVSFFKMLEGFVEIQASPEIKRLTGESLRNALNGPKSAWYDRIREEARGPVNQLERLLQQLAPEDMGSRQ